LLQPKIELGYSRLIQSLPKVINLSSLRWSAC